MRRWLLLTIAARCGVPYQPAARVPRRSTSPPTTTLRQRSTSCSPASTRATSRPASWRWPCCSSARSAPPTAAVASWAGGVSLFWHLVDVIWLFVFTTIWLHPVRRALRCRRSRRRRSRRGVVRRGGGTARPPTRSSRSTTRAGALRRPVRGCHGADGTGVEDRGPALINEGRRPSTSCCAPAACRWPTRHGGQAGAARSPRRRSSPSSTYAGSFGDGPDPECRPRAAATSPVAPTLPTQLRGLPRRVRLRRRDRRRCASPRPDGGHADRDRRGDPRRSRRDARVRRVQRPGPQRSRGLHPRPPGDAKRPRDATTSAASARSPRASPRGCWRCCPLVALTRWIGSPHEGRDVRRSTRASRSVVTREPPTRGAARTSAAYRAAVVSLRPRHRRRHRRGDRLRHRQHRGPARAWGWRPRCSASAFGLVVLGQVPRLRRARGAGSASR